MKNIFELSTKNKRGSAIIMALVTMTFLVTLGLGVIMISFGSLNTNVTDAANNNAYYAAEAGVNSAIEQLKYEAEKYYNEMLASQGSDYSSLYNNFFSSINSSAEQNFLEPSIQGMITETTFTQGAYDTADNTCEFLISCTATAGEGSKYMVNGSLKVKKVDVSAGGSWSVPDRAITAGGTLNLGDTNGISVSGGNVVVGDLERKGTWQLGISGGQLVIDSNAGSVLSDTKKYPSYSDPVISNPNMHITQNNFTVTSSNVPSSPVSITSDEGINVTFQSCTVTSGIIYIKGDVTITNGNYGADIYCDGNFTANNCTITGNVFSRGNVLINDAAMKGEITCDGSLTLIKGSLLGTVYSGTSISVNNASSTGSMFSPGTITINNAGVSNGIIYSSTKINYGNSSTSCILFSGGDIVITGGSSVAGSISAMGDIYGVSDSKIWLTLNYSRTGLENIFSNPNNTFFTTSSQPVLDQNVILEQKVSAVGRLG
jgi:hypothetical protein